MGRNRNEWGAFCDVIEGKSVKVQSKRATNSVPKGDTKSAVSVSVLRFGLCPTARLSLLSHSGVFGGDIDIVGVVFFSCHWVSGTSCDNCECAVHQRKCYTQPEHG